MALEERASLAGGVTASQEWNKCFRPCCSQWDPAAILLPEEKQQLPLITAQHSELRPFWRSHIPQSLEGIPVGSAAMEPGWCCCTTANRAAWAGDSSRKAGMQSRQFHALVKSCQRRLSQSLQLHILLRAVQSLMHSIRIPCISSSGF